MEKAGNWLAIAKMWEKHLKKKEIFKKRACIFTKNSNLGQFSVSASQPPGCSVSGRSTPNGLFQTINWLKKLMGYSKQLH